MQKVAQNTQLTPELLLRTRIPLLRTLPQSVSSGKKRGMIDGRPKVKGFLPCAVHPSIIGRRRREKEKRRQSKESQPTTWPLFDRSKYWIIITLTIQPSQRLNLELQLYPFPEIRFPQSRLTNLADEILWGFYDCQIWFCFVITLLRLYVFGLVLVKKAPLGVERNNFLFKGGILLEETRCKLGLKLTQVWIFWGEPKMNWIWVWVSIRF